MYTLAVGYRQEGDQPYVISSIMLLITNVSCIWLIPSVPDPQRFQQPPVFYPTPFTPAMARR